MRERLDAGGVIRRVFAIYVEQAPVLMPTAAVVFVFTGILAAVLVSASPGLGLIGLLISLIAAQLYTGMIVELVADVQDGRRDASVSGLVRAVLPILGQLLLVAVAIGVLEVIGIVLLIVPFLVMLTVWSVAIPVVVLERPPGLQALGRSRELVRGNGWQVFGVILVFDILVFVLAGGLQLAAATAGTGVAIVVRVVVGVLTAPLAALAAAVLYFELRRGERAPAPVPDPPDLAGPGSS